MTMPMPRRARRRPSSGFTLVELAVVVVIVGVLAVLAVVGYRQYMLNAKLTEATAMISAIRIAQQDRFTEAGSYANLGSATYCPQNSATGGTYDKKWSWNPGCSSGTDTWDKLAVHNDGPVQFGYATVAGSTATITVPTDANWVTFPTTATTAWYIVVAQADLNNTSANSLKSTLVGSSFTNQIFQQNPGQ